MVKIFYLLIASFGITSLHPQVLKHEKAIESIATLGNILITTTYRNKVSISKINQEPIKNFFLNIKGYKKGGFNIATSPNQQLFLLSPKMQSYQKTVIFSRNGKKLSTIAGAKCLFESNKVIACVYYDFSERFYIKNTEIRKYTIGGKLTVTQHHYKKSHHKIIKYFKYLSKKEIYITANRRMLQTWSRKGKHIRTIWPRRGYGFTSIDVSQRHNLLLLALSNEVYFYNLKGLYKGRIKTSGMLLKIKIYDYDKVVCAFKKKSKSQIVLYSKKGDILRSYQQANFTQQIFSLLTENTIATYEKIDRKIILRVFSNQGQEIGKSKIDIPFSSLLYVYHDETSSQMYLTFLDRYKRSGGSYISPAYALEGIIKVFSPSGSLRETIFNH